MLLYVSYEGRVFTCPAAGMVVFTVSGVYPPVHTTPTTDIWSQPSAFQYSPQPLFILFISDLATAGIIKMCSCLLHNSSQAENSADKMTKMSTYVCSLHWQDLIFWKLQYLPNWRKHFAVLVFLFCTYLEFLPLPTCPPSPYSNQYAQQGLCLLLCISQGYSSSIFFRLRELGMERHHFKPSLPPDKVLLTSFG